MGVRTVRIDLEGIGDSDGDERTLLSNASLYHPGRTEQTLAVLRALEARGLSDRFVLGGLCSGAYWSLHAALADSRVAGALMINLYAFHWSEELVGERDTQAALGSLRGRGWRRLARGDFNAKQLGTLMHSVRPGRIRRGARLPVERQQAPLVERAFDQLRQQGTEALFLLSDGEPLQLQLARQGYLDRLDGWPNVHVERIPSRDHMFRALRLQRQVHQSLDQALDRVLAAAPSDQRLAPH